VIGRLVAGVIVVGLAIGVWALWPRGETDTTPATSVVVVATTTTSTITIATTTTVVEPTTTSTLPGSHVVATVEEAEEILRDLWFGWFEGIYNQDEDRIREVVASQTMLDQATFAFGASFESSPTLEGVWVSSAEILRSDAECLVVWHTVDVTAFRGEGRITDAVLVLRSLSGTWLMASTWVHRGDLWESDCVAQLEPLS